jgi:hypothetical protein
MEANRPTKHYWESHWVTNCQAVRKGGRGKPPATRHPNGSQGRKVYWDSARASHKTGPYNLELKTIYSYTSISGYFRGIWYSQSHSNDRHLKKEATPILDCTMGTSFYHLEKHHPSYLRVRNTLIPNWSRSPIGFTIVSNSLSTIHRRTTWNLQSSIGRSLRNRVCRRYKPTCILEIDRGEL